MKEQSKTSKVSRRQFIKTGAKATVIGSAAIGVSLPGISRAKAAHVAGSDTIRLGLIGAGGRGTGAAAQAIKNDAGVNVELVAIGDVFENRMNSSLGGIANEAGKDRKDKVNVPESNRFTGFDSFKKVLDSNCNMVILATPPGFRPLHFEAAVNAGKHVFMEKPVAVDAPGVRRVLAAGEIAAQKGLVVQVGLQRRHENAYRETIAALRDGIIGNLICSRVYWNNPGVWVNPRQAGQSELEYQMRNWFYFNWLCGDHIVEQHIHNTDVINWLLNDYPKTANGMGGRQVRIHKDSGQIFDHHCVEYTYANGHKMFSQCRHMPDCWNEVSEFVHGSEGWADISGGKIYDKDGKKIFHSKGSRGGHQQEHHNMFKDIAEGKVPNEAEHGAKSTMTAIMGRMATYTGVEIDWNKAINSKMSLADVDKLKSLDDEAPVQPKEDGTYPIPVPGTGRKDIIDF